MAPASPAPVKKAAETGKTPRLKRPRGLSLRPYTR
jgi:hypothetical protein